MDTELIEMHKRAVARADEFDDEVRGFMQHLLICNGLSAKREPGWAHDNYYGLVLDLATAPRIESLDLPPGYDEMEMGNCYRNALELAMGDDDLVYCEGFAQSNFVPLEHAWVVRRSDGLVIDPTWQPTKFASECIYFGIRFETEFAVRRTTQIGWTSLLAGDNCRSGANAMLRDGLKMHDGIAYDLQERS